MDAMPELHVAVMNGNSNYARRLLAKGATVSSRDYLSRTPLHMAVVFGKEEVSKILLMNTPKSLLDSFDCFGRTALHYAAGLGRLSLVKVMLDRGANVNAVDKLNLTPLHLAADNRDSQVVMVLLRKGADKDRKDSLGRKPFFFAERVNSHGIMTLLQPTDDSLVDGVANISHGKVEVREAIVSRKCELADLLNAWKGNKIELKPKEESISATSKACAVEIALADWREVMKCKPEMKSKPCTSASETCSISASTLECSSCLENGASSSRERCVQGRQLAVSVQFLQMALDVISANQSTNDILRCTEWEVCSRGEHSLKAATNYDHQLSLLQDSLTHPHKLLNVA